MEAIKITGTLVNAFFVCHRKVWLFAHEISPLVDDPFLELGRIISETTYARKKKEILLENLKIDLIESENGHTVVGEIKKSSRALNPAKMQLAFYLYSLKKKGIKARGELLIPKEKKRIELSLDRELIEELEKSMKKIGDIIRKETPPPPKESRFCKRCALREFCYA